VIFQRPLLPIPVKIVGSQEKRLRLDFNGNSDGNSSNSASISNDSSGLSTPVTCPSSPPSNILTATQSPSSLPTLFSQLNMTSIPPKPKTAASFNSDWKKLKPYSDMSAQYLKVMFISLLATEFNDFFCRFLFNCTVFVILASRRR
jgi:hypothetical protein